MAKSEAAAIGFRVKSGWAAFVLVRGPRDAPKVLGRGRVELSDASVPESIQPYHASTGKEETDDAKIQKRVAVVKKAAARSVTELLARQRELAPRLHFAGLVVGSLIEPEKIANPHIRAHAHEGKLFRTVLAEALARCDLRCRVVREEDLHAEAAKVLGLSEAEIRSIVDGMKRDVGSPWAANEKLAALLAWMMLE